MPGRRQWVAAAVAVGCIASAGLGGGADTAAAKPAKTTISIDTHSGGVHGFLASSSPRRCAAGRRIVVFRQLGPSRSPGSDRRVATARSGAPEAAYIWTADAAAAGRLYAWVGRKAGCAPALSRTVATALGAAADGPQADYPPCGPYVSEGLSDICRLDDLLLALGMPPISSCRFAIPRGSCDGMFANAPFPWGTAADGHPVTGQFSWETSDRGKEITILTRRAGEPGPGLLAGTLSAAAPARFSVSDAFAQNDLGHPNGDRFYTPDLPGQAAGEPGGPLLFRDMRASDTYPGEQFIVSGYLYLKR